jgi:hypothetical protein
MRIMIAEDDLSPAVFSRLPTISIHIAIGSSAILDFRLSFLWSVQRLIQVDVSKRIRK